MFLKNMIKKFVMLGLICGMCNIAAAAPPEHNPPMPETTLFVTGEGKSESAPDLATVVVGISTHEADSAAAQNVNAAKTNAVLEALKELGIDAKDIQTQDYSFYPTYHNDRSHNHQIDGYQVHNSVVIRLQNMNLIGTVIDTALAHGANKVHSLNFGIKNTKSLREAAMKEAVANAREKAEIITKALGLKIKGIRHVTEMPAPSPEPMRANAMMLAKGVGEASFDTAVETGTLTLNAGVNIEFIIGE